MNKAVLKTILFTIIVNYCFAQTIQVSFQSEINKRSDYVRDAIYSPYKQWMAVDMGNDILLLDELGHEIYTAKRSSTYGDFCFSPDEKYLLIRNWRVEGDLAFFDLNSLSVKNVVHKEGFKDAYKMAYAGDINHLLFKSDKQITLFYVNEKTEMTLLQTFHTDKKFSIREFSVSDNGKWLAVTETGIINISDNAKYSGFGVTLYEFNGNKYIEKDNYASSLSKNFTRIIPGSEKLILSVQKEYGDKENALIMFDCSKGKFNQIDRHELENEAEYAGLSKDGKWLATSPWGVTFYFIGKNKFEKREEKLWYYNYPHIIEFSPDGKHLLTYQKEKTLVQWNIDGVGGDIRSQLYNALLIDFSPAFKTVLSGCSNCFDKTDKSMIVPKGEFETSEQFEKRREKTKNEILSVLQQKLEEQNKITRNGKTGLKPGYLIGYNADREIFKATILGEEVAINVKLENAKQLKNNYEDAIITYSKKNAEGITQYENFSILDTKTGISHPFTFRYNPFSFQNKKQRKGEQSYSFETPVIKKKHDNIQANDSAKQVYALIIATNDYTEFEDLQNPVLDGETIAKELKERYNAITELIIDPTLISLKMKLREYAGYTYNEGDQVLIFIAGHGHFDNIYKEGYIVTSDSRLNDEAQVSFLSHSSLKTIVKNIPCKHILLVMDVCFGGTFDQAIATGARGKDIYDNIDKENYIERKMQYKTRLVITSGGKKYVPDGRPGQHSPFARNFLAALRSDGGDDGILTVSEIKTFLDKTETQPYFGEFEGNEPGSDFVLINKQ